MSLEVQEQTCYRVCIFNDVSYFICNDADFNAVSISRYIVILLHLIISDSLYLI